MASSTRAPFVSPNLLPSASQAANSSATIQVGPLHVTLESQVPGLAQAVRSLYSGACVPFPVDGEDCQEPLRALYQIQGEAPNKRKPPTYRLVRDDETICQHHSGDPLLPCLEWSITDAAMRSTDGYHLLHAGAIARNGHGILLPAPSGSGKSTTVAALALHGFEYCSDEVAFVGSDARLRPFPKIISLKEGGWREMTRRFPDAVSREGWPTAAGGGVRHVKPPAIPSAERAQRGYPIDLVIIPRYDPDQPTTLRPISRSQTLKELVEQSMNLRLWGPPGLDLLLRVVHGARCYSLTVNDLGDAVVQIEGLTG